MNSRHGSLGSGLRFKAGGCHVAGRESAIYTLCVL